MMEQEQDDSSPQLPSRMYLFLENPSKNNNLGSVLRCASAFGIQTVVAVGYDKCAVEGSQGASKHVQLVAFPTSFQAVSYLQDTCHCRTILGLMGSLSTDQDEAIVHVRNETEEDALVQTVLTQDDANEISQKDSDNALIRVSTPISHDMTLQRSLQRTGHGDQKNVAIAISKHSFGLPHRLAQHCDALLHIPHCAIASDETRQQQQPQNHCSLIDLPASLSIALYHISNCLDYHERIFEGHKFYVNRDNSERSAAEREQDMQQIRQQRERGRRQKRQDAETAMQEGFCHFFEEDTVGDY